MSLTGYQSEVQDPAYRPAHKLTSLAYNCRGCILSTLNNCQPIHITRIPIIYTSTSTIYPSTSTTLPIIYKSTSTTLSIIYPFTSTIFSIIYIHINYITNHLYFFVADVFGNRESIIASSNLNILLICLFEALYL